MLSLGCILFLKNSFEGFSLFRITFEKSTKALLVDIFSFFFFVSRFWLNSYKILLIDWSIFYPLDESRYEVAAEIGLRSLWLLGLDSDVFKSLMAFPVVCKNIIFDWFWGLYSVLSRKFSLSACCVLVLWPYIFKDRLFLLLSWVFLHFDV